MSQPDLPQPVLKPTDPCELFSQQKILLPAEIALFPESLRWVGRENDVIVYEALDMERIPCKVRFVFLISEEEKIIFRAFQDWYAGALRKLSDRLKGYYTFEVLQFWVGDAPRSWGEFSELLARHAAKLSISDRRVIQFGSLWGVLERHTEGDFGRIESKLMSDFFKPKPDFLARKLKKVSSQINSGEQDVIVFGDGSAQTLFDDSEQLEVFKTLIRKKLPGKGEEQAFFWHLKSNRYLRI